MGPPFPCFSCEDFADPNSRLFCLNFCSILTSISISCTQRGNVQKLHFCLNVSMQTIAVFEHQMSLRVFDTQLGAQGMENISEIWYCLVPFLTQGGPSSVLVLIASKRLVLFFNGIQEGIPCRGNQKYCRFLYGPFLKVSVPPVLNMGDDLEE
jgi:hypothetical protein